MKAIYLLSLIFISPFYTYDWLYKWSITLPIETVLISGKRWFKMGLLFILNSNFEINWFFQKWDFKILKIQIVSQFLTDWKDFFVECSEYLPLSKEIISLKIFFPTWNINMSHSSTVECWKNQNYWFVAFCAKTWKKFSLMIFFFLP